MKLWRRRVPPAPAPRAEPQIGKPSREMKISAFALDGWQARGESAYTIAQPMPGVTPAGAPLAMDAVNSLYTYASINSMGTEISFPGFPLLAELSQRAEYRHISETLAREMTRKWVILESDGDDDNTDKLERLTALMNQHRLAQKFRMAATHDGLFGRGHIFVEINGQHDDSQFLSAKLPRTSSAIPRGAQVAFRNVEPIWTYPNNYNASNPLAPNFYVPESWYVNGTVVHRSRILTFIGRPLPDILKPAYGFAGMSMSQLAIPYVQNWLRTRQSVSDMLHSFSVMVLKTVMAGVLQGGGADAMVQRAQLFNQARDNRGLMMVDKEAEDLANVSAPISGLDKLQAQSQEQLASVSTQPLVVQTGITPSGLNASSDGEIRIWYDRVLAAQEAVFRDNLEDCLDILQLVEFGEVDPTIKVRFVHLWQLDEAGDAAVQKTLADRDVELVEAGVLSPEEARTRLAKDPGSGYNNIDVSDVPEPPEAAGAPVDDPETNSVERRSEEEGVESKGGASSGV